MIDRPDVKMTAHEEGGSLFWRLTVEGEEGAGWALCTPDGRVLPQEREREKELERAYQESRAQTDTAP